MNITFQITLKYTGKHSKLYLTSFKRKKKAVSQQRAQVYNCIQRGKRTAENKHVIHSLLNLKLKEVCQYICLKDYVKVTRYIPSKRSCLSGIQHQLILMRNRGREKSNMYSKPKKRREFHHLSPEKRKHPQNMP